MPGSWNRPTSTLPPGPRLSGIADGHRSHAERAARRLNELGHVASSAVRLASRSPPGIGVSSNALLTEVQFRYGIETALSKCRDIDTISI